jgi:prolyl oligopeptidase
LSKVCCIAIFCALLPLLAGSSRGVSESSAAFDYPPARRGTATDNFHGVAVHDFYRWLEDSSSDETKNWISQEDLLVQRFVQQETSRPQIEHRMKELFDYDLYTAPGINPPVVKRKDRVFFVRVKAGESEPVLLVRDANHVRELFEAGSRYGGQRFRLVRFDPSPDGRFLVCGVSEDQSNWLTYHIISADSGKEIGSLSGGHTTGSIIAWTVDSKGFFYTRFGKTTGSNGESSVKHPEIFYHALTDEQSQDKEIYAREDKPGWLYSYSVSGDGHYLVLEAREGSARAGVVMVKDIEDANSMVRPLIPDSNADYSFLGSDGNRFYFYSDLNAPKGRVVAVNLSSSEIKEVVPEGMEPIAGRSSVGGNAIGMFNRRLLLMYLRDGAPFLRIFDLQGRLQGEVTLPAGGSIWGGFSGSPDDPKVFYQYLGLTDPSSIYELDVRSGKSTSFLASKGKFDPENYVIRRVFFKSQDGTRIPMFVAHRRGLRRDGKRPAWLYAYGAFGWVSFVWYQPHMLAWMDLGGVFAVPAIRGGGEYGESWHIAGTKENKQNAINDYLAAAKWLIKNNYTSHQLLVANGGSASAALAAAAVQQHPELFGASIIDRPILDMIRFDRFTAGSYWSPEFGSPSVPGEFRALYSYSPYHHAPESGCYPPMLVMSGDKDQVAVPAHAYKFVAKSQAEQRCSNPVMLKVMWGAGHNFGVTPEQNVDSFTNALTFLAHVLKLKVHFPNLRMSTPVGAAKYKQERDKGNTPQR